ncbi:MAG: nucleotidyltransferase domain-containing protein [Myxococcales bacterium]|nr:nucleotidyltransferase domain-containing protein [Myxococcales bacterium]
MRREGFLAVAITGSIARGDATRGSDLDLWCLAPGVVRHQRRALRWSGVDVTLLVDGRRSAGSLRSLSRCETEDLLVLHDPLRLFPGLQRRARAVRSRAFRVLCRATSRALLDELREGARGSDLNRLPPLREAALRFAAAWAYRAHGYRTPRWRTLERVLPAGERRLLEKILAVPPRRDARKALAAARRACREVGSPLPPDALARLRADEWREGVLLTRRHLERVVLGPLLQRAGAWEVEEVPQRSVRRALVLLHRPSAADPRQTARDIEALARRLRVLGWFSPAVAAWLSRAQGR